MKFLSYVEKLEKENKWQFWVIIGLLVIVFVEGLLLYRASTHKVVLVLPPQVDREFWVSGDTLSRAYLEQVALFVADRLLTVSPENVEKSIASVYPFLTTEPEHLKAIKEQLAGYSATVKREDWSQVFYPLKVVITDKGISVEGVLKKIVGNTYVGQERKTISFTYEVRNGRLVIKEVKF